MSTVLDSLGISYEVSQSTETLNLSGKETTKEFVVTTLALPTPPRIQATFIGEGLSKKLVKLFRNEILIGDKTFDDAVHISTDTPSETAAFLESTDIQTTILSTVNEGGSIEIGEREIVAKIPGNGDDRQLVQLVRAVLAG